MNLNDVEKLWCPFFYMCETGETCSLAANKATEADEVEDGLIYCMTLPPDCLCIKEKYRKKT